MRRWQNVVGKERETPTLLMIFNTQALWLAVTIFHNKQNVARDNLWAYLA